MRALLALASIFVATAAHAAPPAAAPVAPLRFIGTAEKVTLSENGAAPQTMYRLTHTAPVKLATTGQMSLLLTARPLLAAGAKAEPITVTVVLTDASGASATMRETFAPDATTRIAAGAGLTASAPRTVRIPIASAIATVELRADRAPGALLSFSRTGFSGASVAMSPGRTDPKLDESVLEAIPMIRKSVERFSVGPRAGFVVPPGGDLAFGGLANVYLGAEMRFTPPQLERRLAVCLEGALYEIRDRETIVGTEPIGSSDAGDVLVATRVAPVMAGLRYRFSFAESLGLFAAGGGGAAFTQRIETVRFRDDRSRGGVTGAAFVRVGADRKVGRGRSLAFDVTYLHLLDGKNTGYLGGLVTGVHYRLLY